MLNETARETRAETCGRRAGGGWGQMLVLLAGEGGGGGGGGVGVGVGALVREVGRAVAGDWRCQRTRSRLWLW